MNIDLVSVFPEYFDSLRLSLLGKAQSDGLITITAHNLRDWTHDVHHSVDDTPVGGGAGMVMKPEIWGRCLDDLLHYHWDISDSTVQIPTNESNSHDTASGAIDPMPTQTTHSTNRSNTSQSSDMNPLTDIPPTQLATATPAVTCDDAQASDTAIIFPNPSARPFTQADAAALSHKQHLVFGCGRYEGIDARVPEFYATQGFDVRQYSIGDYVLNGGEVAVCVMIEAITRLLPEFMGNPESIVTESYTGEPLLEHRQFTKPKTWRNLSVPTVLTSGHHAHVARYRRNESLERTSILRPDLIEQLRCHDLDKADRAMLTQLGWNVAGMHPVRPATRR